jgi:epoxyqueuosine reductase QueG
MTREEWFNITIEQFNRLFKNSPIERRKYEPFMRNVTIVTKSGS